MSRLRLTVAEFLRGELAYRERPSDRERAEHAARLNTAPRGDHVFNKSTQHAPHGCREEGPMQAATIMSTPPRDWYEDHDNLASVAAHAREAGALDDRSVWDFLDSPWHFDELYEAWRIWLQAEAAADLRVDAYLERDAA